MTVVLDPNDVLTIYEGCYEDLECGGTVMLVESLPQNTSYSFSYKCSEGTQPAVIDSNGEYCTTISGANTLDSTCQYSPTPQPTSSATVQLAVVQTITNCPYSDYLNQQKKYDKTFKESIVASLQSSISITIDDILNFQVQDATTRRKLLQTTPALTISYTLQSSSVSATTLSSALTQAISSGTFDKQLNTIAAKNGATGLTTASSSAPSITNNSPTLAPTPQPSNVTHGYAVATVWADEACTVNANGGINYQVGYLTNSCITEYDSNGIAVSSILATCNSTTSNFAVSKYNSTTCEPSTYLGQLSSNTTECISTSDTYFADLGLAYSLECVDNPSFYDNVDALIDIDDSVRTLSYADSSAGCVGTIVKFSATATNVCFGNGNESSQFFCESNSPYYSEYSNATCPASQQTSFLPLATACLNTSSLNLTSGATVDGYYAQTRCYPAQPSNSSTTYPTFFPTTLSPTAYPTYGPSYVYINYYVDETCYGEVMFQHGYLTNYCQPDGPKNSLELSCSPEGVTVTIYESTDCSGTPYQFPVTTLSCDRNTAIQCNIGTDIEDIVLMESGILIT